MNLNSLAAIVLTFATCWFSQTIAAQDLSFELPELDGKSFKLENRNEKKLTVVCFLGTECPLANLYATRLSQLASAQREVQFIGIFSNQQDSLADILAYRDEHKINFPIVKDTGNLVADQFKAIRTPEVFVLDHDLTIVYRGRIDDQYRPGIAKSSPARQDLKIALIELLSGRPVSVDRTEPEGCLIGRISKTADPDNKITYANQISRILQNHCSECHRRGEIGPMELTDYDEVVGWAEMILEVVDDNRMPPWHADPKHGQFVNERRMTVAEKQMLRHWVDAGAPKGDLNQLPPPREQIASTQWRLPNEPDLVVEMRATPFSIPAEGTVEYQYFVVDPKFTEDKWIIAAEILPGNRSVLHHSIVFVRPPDGTSFHGIGWLAAYVPGQSAPTLNPEFGRKIPAGSKLVFQQHYTPIGKQTTDVTRIGMIFGEEEKIKNEVFTLLAMDQEFVIPPGAENHQVAAQFRGLPKRGNLLGMSPHMHYRGKSFELIANRKDSNQTNATTTETLLNVPVYDFNWQHIYQLKDPIPLSSIESLKFIASFDNSANNPANPDPLRTVTWGDQTWEEMAVAFVVVAVPRETEKTIDRANPTPEQAAAWEKYKTFIQQKAESFVTEYFDRFDANRDDKISKSEYPVSIRRFGRWQTDINDDGIVTRPEVRQAAMDHFMNKFPGAKFDPVLKNF